MTYNQCLLRVPIFKDLDITSLQDVSKLIQPLNLEKNEILFEIQDSINNLFILHSGTLQVYTVSEEGLEHTIRTISEGDFIGEDALIQEEIATFGVRALEPSHICVIDGHAFRNMLGGNPRIAIEIIDALIKRIKKTEIKHIEAVSLTARQRIIQRLFVGKNVGDRVVLRTSKKDFASSLDMTPETLSRNLSKMEDEGLIRLIGQRTIEVLKAINT